jgi:hypothetical protein
VCAFVAFIHIRFAGNTCCSVLTWLGYLSRRARFPPSTQAPHCIAGRILKQPWQKSVAASHLVESSSLLRSSMRPRLWVKRWVTMSWCDRCGISPTLFLQLRASQGRCDGGKKMKSEICVLLQGCKRFKGSERRGLSCLLSPSRRMLPRRCSAGVLQKCLLAFVGW